ncbi:serine-threonine protein kinase, plant-type, putative [Ricinus communis]|uniref:non-specific serine/threonine protein kinase n=1 Tax=Ricinus communis TaxID=3988 RepID=B9SJH2_RICCO|nr:serine-threonine protein kinase, plant-type, putative [Ricinus communis]
MDYLHHDCEPPIVHCDLKPGNVLLDHDMVAHVADFGLARFVSQHSSGNGSWTIGLKGSIGYIAPEYGLGGSASTSGDVYSFGILLLELFIAKKPTNEMFQEGLNLNNFATKVNENHVTEIADPRLFRNDEHFSSESTSTKCETLRNVRHRNLVKVITSCSSIEHTGEEFKALVMEFISHGSLDKWLYEEADGEGSGLCLTLLQRLNIAIDVASAMDYLHNDCEPPILHCDLKPGNVQLDHDMVAHVADFGLARFASQDSSRNGSRTIGVRGSIGYIAPEYGMGGSASTSGDVYSFGILLLELFIAKKPTNVMFQEGLSLSNFAMRVNENHVTEIADPRLFKSAGQFSTESTITNDYFSDHDISRNSNRSSSAEKGEEFIAAAIRVGLSCAAHSANDRLTMREALSKLQKIKKAALQIVQGDPQIMQEILIV